MKKPNIPFNEQDRLKELNAYQIIGVDENKEYDFITSLAAQICGTNSSLISLVTEDKQWFLSHHGMKMRETSKDYSFCAHAINTPDQALVVNDAREDERFSDNPFTIGDPHILFYAGIPLISLNGFPLGTLCVIDDSPKQLSDTQIDLLKKLAMQTTSLLELRRSQREIKALNSELIKKNLLFTITEEANQIGTWELDLITGKTFWSRVVYQIHEVALDYDHYRANAIEFYHPDYRHLIANALERAIKNDEPIDVECILITAKGNHKWVRSTGRKIENKLIGSFQDITKIKENELKFKGIFNSTFSFIGFLNREGILLEANDTALNMAALKHEDVIGKYFWDCYWWQISAQTQEELKKNFQKALSGEVAAYEVVVWVANQTPITILFSLKPIFDDQGKVIYVVPEGRPVQEIVDARRKHKSVIDGTNVGTWEWNVQTGETVFNERWAEIAGYTLEELAPISIETWMMLAHPDDLEESGRKLNECFEKKSEFYDFEARMKHKDGHWVWVYDRGKVFEWTEDHKPLMMYGTHQDISERKQKEESLRISEEAFRGNFENAAVGMALLDKNGKWLEVNTKLCETVGYTEEELKQLTFQDITHPDDLDADLALLGELVRGERNHYQMEKRYYHKDGQIVYILLAVSMVKDGDGKVLYFISQIIDISKLKHTEIQLKKLLAENEALMDATTEVAFVSTTTDGKIINTNTGVRKILGYKNEEVKGKSIQHLLFLENEWKEFAKEILIGLPEEGEKLDLVHALANDKKQRTREWTFKKKNGKVLLILLSVTEIVLDNKINGYLFAATDISHIKSIQGQLEQKNEELEQFAYVAAHDLKEPLRGITTYLSILQKRYSKQLDEKANSYIDNAYNNAGRMKNLITDILDFSKTGDVGKEQVNLDELLDMIFANYHNDDKFKKSILSKSKLPTIKGDTSSFVQLFTNLVDNGIKYQPEDNVPEITIHATEDEKSWAFSITDNGIGINPEHQDKVFEIFKRLHTDSEYSGTGIGLASCKKIVSAYGGKISFEPNESKGTIFKFTIPKL
ncbi:PAS domain S-box protein [Rhodonellum sp.]|uniref:PAS domain S-box protein n=1 Tax=Rhodonellum sp. TaxID=2231180 RepID=UPI00272010F3|nr:PAS domain S-box protein [Rhodonellum sp.]MDO9554233.1 PAS domain S-box protein [Rhodonellum sp.]